MAARVIAAQAFVIATMAIGTLTAGCASPSTTALPRFTVVVEKANPPEGWIEFCHDQPLDCRGKQTAAPVQEHMISVPLQPIRPIAAAAQFANRADLTNSLSTETSSVGAKYFQAVQRLEPQSGITDSIVGQNIESAMQGVILTDESFAELERANRSVNAQIKPMTDFAHYGVPDKWTYPNDGLGDCEDYALLKRHLLLEAGWPSEVLLITVVWDKGDEGHTVLTVRTDRGDLVLDNESSKIVLWSASGYSFVKRQSQADPNAWVYIDGDRFGPAVAT